MTDAVLEQTMTRDEAEGCWNRIYAHSDSIKSELYDLYHRMGWLALDYKNWIAMVSDKLPGHCQSHYYYLLKAATVEHGLLEVGDIEPSFSKILESMPISHLDALKTLSDPVEQKAVLQLAYSAAEKVTLSGKPTAALIEEAAAVVREVKATGGVQLSPDSSYITAAEAKVITNHYERVQDHIDTTIVRKSKQTGARKDGPVSVVNLAHAKIRMVNEKMKQITFEFENLDDAENLIQCYHNGHHSDLIVSVVRRSAKEAVRSLPA